MEPIAIERSIWIKASRERVWQAVTTAEQLERWYAINHAWEIPALQIGARLKFHNSDTEVLHATIAELIPQEKFALRWDASPPHEDVVLVTSFILAEEDGGVRLTIHESGYENLPEEERQQWLEATGSGYVVSIENLKALLEGTLLPNTERV